MRLPAGRSAPQRRPRGQSPGSRFQRSSHFLRPTLPPGSRGPPPAPVRRLLPRPEPQPARLHAAGPKINRIPPFWTSAFARRAQASRPTGAPSPRTFRRFRCRLAAHRSVPAPRPPGPLAPPGSAGRFPECARGSPPGPGKPRAPLRARPRPCPQVRSGKTDRCFRAPP